jgi:hypothetical protein
MLTATELRDLLDYRPETGEFIWRARAARSYRDGQWNHRYAGTTAGSASDRGYIIISIRRVHYRAHRLAWLFTYEEWPTEGIDHIDGDPANNQITNLRRATQLQNIANARLSSKNTSGFKGVFWHRQSGKWRAGIKEGGRFKSLGLFDDPAIAHNAYMAAAVRIHGAFARAK